MRLRSLVVVVFVLGSLIVTGRASATPPGANPNCGTVSTSFTLTANRFCDESGWVVEEDGITIDLGGLTLSSDHADDDATPETEFGIDVAGHKDVTIRNGAIVGFETGIFGIGTNLRVANVVATHNIGAGIVVGGRNAVATGNTATANNVGIAFQGATLSKNTAVNNGSTGISLHEFVSGLDTQGLVEDNVSVANGSSGFFVRSGDDWTLTSNRAVGNDSSGIAVDGSVTRVSIKRNTASGNSPHGIEVEDGATDVGVSRNIAHANGLPDDTNLILGRGIDGPLTLQGSGNIARANDAPVDCDPQSLCVAAGGSTADLPGDNPSCLSNITESFKLTGDTQLCAEDGWTIGKDNITIDLNGFTVRGNGVIENLTDTGIDVDGHHGFTLRNGAVEGFDHGLSTGTVAVRDAVVSNVVFADNNSTGLILNGKRESRVHRVTSVANENGHGILVNAPEVTSNVAAGNELVGIEAPNGSAGTLRANLSVGNGEEGFAVFASGSLLRANRALGNTLNGILVGTKAVMENNIASGNLLNGVRVTSGVTGAKLTGNRSHGNGFPADDGVGGGIALDGSPAVTGGGNQALGNDAANCEGALCP